MSTGRAKSIRRANAPKTAREADARWGFNRSKQPVLKPGRKAYTGEDYEIDRNAGVIAAGVRGCPHTRPNHDCPTTKPGPRERRFQFNSPAPAITNSTWTTRGVVGPWTADGGRPRRKILLDAVPICLDCRAYLYWAERQAYFVEAGFDHRLGYVRPASAIVDGWSRSAAEEIRQFVEQHLVGEVNIDDFAGAGTAELGPVKPPTIDEHDARDIRRRAEQIYGDGRVGTYLRSLEAADDLYRSERASLVRLVGELPDELQGLQRYEQATLLETVRHCLSCNFAARTGLPAPQPRVRLMG